MQIKLVLFGVFSLIIAFAKAQDTIPPTSQTAAVTARDTITDFDYQPLKPAKVAFYSAVLPGLGQAYNKDYWKIPIVYAALGTGVAVAVFNQRQFKRYRNAYKDRIAGRIDEFTILKDDGTVDRQIFTEANLLDAQTLFRRRKELSILITAGIYILQIVEANVSAHLSQFNVDDSLSLQPVFERDDHNLYNTFGANLTFSF